MSQFLYMTSGDLEFQFSCSVLSTLCYTIDCSMPCLPVCHQHPEHAQTHVHWDSDTIQPSHPLLSSSPPTFSLFQHQGLFQWVGSSHDGQSIGASASATDLPVNIQGWFPLGLTDLISLQSKGLTRLFQHHGSKTPVLWCSAFFMVQLSHLYMTSGKIIALTRWTFLSKVSIPSPADLPDSGIEPGSPALQAD